MAGGALGFWESAGAFRRRCLRSIRSAQVKGIWRQGIMSKHRNSVLTERAYALSSYAPACAARSPGVVWMGRWGLQLRDAPNRRREGDTDGNPHRAQMVWFELFEIILLVKLYKQLLVEQFEATVSRSAVPSPSSCNRKRRCPHIYIYIYMHT